MQRFISSMILVMALGLAWSGCATLTPSDRASLALVNIAGVNSTLLETSLEVVLRVTNESNQPLHLAGSSHQFALNGSRLGKGVSNAAIVVPPLGTALLPLTLRLENLKLINRFGDGRVPPEIAYRLESRLFIEGTGRDLLVVTEGGLDLRPYLRDLQLVAP